MENYSEKDEGEIAPPKNEKGAKETAVIATMTDFPEAPEPEKVIEYRERALQELTITTNQANVEVEPIEIVKKEPKAKVEDEQE